MGSRLGDAVTDPGECFSCFQLSLTNDVNRVIFTPFFLVLSWATDVCDSAVETISR